MTTIITTTGLSIYFRARNEYKTGAPTEAQMRQLLQKQPEKVSAEVNSLQKIAKKDDHLIFLHTDTAPAKQCIDILRDFFIDKGFKPFQIEVKKLQFYDDEYHMETQGMRNLINTMIDEIEKAQRGGQEVVINATAGLKAQIVYSSLIGMIYHVPVKYMYETFEKVVTFIPVALDWDTDLFFTYDQFFNWLDDNLLVPEQVIEGMLKSISDIDRDKVRSMLTEPDADGYVSLSPMGEALRRRFRRETEDANTVDMPPDATEKNFRKKIASSLLEVKHHHPKKTLAVCEKIAQFPWVEGIIGGNFENTLRKSVKDIHEDGTIRLLWADNEKATNLTVQTTARGRPQTLKVADKIKTVLEEQ